MQVIAAVRMRERRPPRRARRRGRGRSAVSRSPSCHSIGCLRISAWKPPQVRIPSSTRKFGRAGRELDVRGADRRARSRDAARSARTASRRCAAIFLPSRMPPTRPRLICMIDAAPWSSTRANSYFVTSRSPVAIGMVVERATRAISSGISGGVGSSNQSGSNGSRRRASRIAPAVGELPVGAEEQVAARADGLSHRRDVALGAVDRLELGLPRINAVAQRPTRIELDGREPESGVLGCPAGGDVGVAVDVRRIVRLGIEVGVGAQRARAPARRAARRSDGRRTCRRCPRGPSRCPTGHRRASGRGAWRSRWRRCRATCASMWNGSRPTTWRSTTSSIILRDEVRAERSRRRPRRGPRCRRR